MSKLNRRSILSVAGSLAAAAALPRTALAQMARNVRLIVGFPPGGAADVLARGLSENLRGALDAPVIVENRPGAGGRLAADYVPHSPPDGSTVLVSPASVITMAPYLYKNTPYSGLRDFKPITALARLDIALYAGPSAPASVNSIHTMTQWLHGNAASASYGIPGLGSTPHLAALLIGRQSGLDWQLVPYQGDSPNFVALLGGEIGVAVSSLAGGMEYLRAGKLRLLAVTGAQRSAFFPDVPTAAESGLKDVVVEDRHSVFLPEKTPHDKAEALNKAIRTAMNSPEMTTLLQRLSLERSTNSLEEFSAILTADSARWQRTIKALNISME